MLVSGRPENLEQRLDKERRVYDLLDKLDIEYQRIDHGITMTMEECLERLRESGAQLALIEQQAPAALETALEDAGYAVARLDTLSTRSETEDGIEGYLDAMMENAKAVAEACRRILE